MSSSGRRTSSKSDRDPINRSNASSPSSSRANSFTSRSFNHRPETPRGHPFNPTASPIHPPRTVHETLYVRSEAPGSNLGAHAATLASSYDYNRRTARTHSGPKVGSEKLTTRTSGMSGLVDDSDSPFLLTHPARVTGPAPVRTSQPLIPAYWPQEGGMVVGKGGAMAGHPAQLRVLPASTLIPSLSSLDEDEARLMMLVLRVRRHAKVAVLLGLITFVVLVLSEVMGRATTWDHVLAVMAVAHALAAVAAIMCVLVGRTMAGWGCCCGRGETPLVRSAATSCRRACIGAAVLCALAVGLSIKPIMRAYKLTKNPGDPDVVRFICVIAMSFSMMVVMAILSRGCLEMSQVLPESMVEDEVNDTKNVRLTV